MRLPVIPPECKKLLKRHSEQSRHYRIVPLNWFAAADRLP